MMMATKTKPIIKFKRMADALFEEVMTGGGSSSGSDHLPSGSLSDLVNSFIQRVDEETRNDHGGHDERDGDELDDVDSDNSNVDDERKDLLKNLLGDEDDDLEVVELRRNITEEIEASFRDQISFSPKNFGFKRQLMTHLRQRGYDAGLCKSRWEKTGRYPGGSYEYVDITTTGERYIVEVIPAGQFEIARPTAGYNALLSELPRIYVGKPQTLKQIVRLMTSAMKQSLKSSALQVAPWRRNSYLQAHWFAPYKRTTNAAPTMTGEEGGSKMIKRTVVGFVEDLSSPAAKGLVFGCRHEFGSKGGIRTGLLAAAFQPKSS